MSIPIAQFITPPSPPHRGFPPLVSIRLFSTSVSQLLPCKPVHLYHFSRFHICVIIYDICFSLSDLLHSVGQSLGPSTSLQITQFRSFLWPSNIPLYICQSHYPNSSYNHPPPTTFPSWCPYVVLYVSVSISALQTGSSVPFF